MVALLIFHVIIAVMEQTHLTLEFTYEVNFTPSDFEIYSMYQVSYFVSAGSMSVFGRA